MVEILPKKTRFSAPSKIVLQSAEVLDSLQASKNIEESIILLLNFLCVQLQSVKDTLQNGQYSIILSSTINYSILCV